MDDVLQKTPVNTARTSSMVWRVFWMIVALVVAASAAAGCQKSHRKDGEDLAEKPPIEAKSADAQEKFDEAKSLLIDGEYERAAERFRLLQADHSDDPIADVAELYAARASLGDLSPGRFSGVSEQTLDLSASRRRLESLASSKSVDDRVSYGAQAYLAAAHSLEGARADVYATLERYPGPSVGSVVLEADRPVLLLLIGEAMRKADRQGAAVGAYGRLYDIYAEHRPAADTDNGAAATSPAPNSPDQTEEVLFDEGDLEQLSAWVDMGRARALQLADRKMSDGALQEMLTAESAFLRAVSGWGMLRDMLEEGVEPEEARAAAEDLFNRISPDLVQIGAGGRAAELSASLAAAGGPRRLAIGVVLPLSGQASGVGAKVMAGALMAARAFDSADEPSVTLVFEDSARPAEEVFKAFSKQGVTAVVGPLDRSRAVEYAAAADQFQIPLMTMTAQSARELMGQAEGDDAGADESAKKPEEQGDGERQGEQERSYVFRNFVDPRAEARAAARLAFEQAGDRKAAVIYPGIGYGRTMADEFRSEFREMGGQIVVEVEYDRNSSDFASVAERLAGSEAEAVFVPDSASKVAELTAFFANTNIWGYPVEEAPPSRSKRKHVHYLGTSLWQDPMLIRQARSYVDGAAVPSWFSPSHSSDRVERFVRRYDALYGRHPENFEAFAYDSVSWFMSLQLERGMTRPEALRDALLSSTSFAGVTGVAKFRADGEAVRELRFVTPGDEGFEPLPFTATTESSERDEASRDEARQGNQPGDDTEASGARPE